MNPRPPATDRLFLAIVPDPATAARVAQLQQALRDAHGLKGRQIALGNLHVTLHFFGDFPQLPREFVAALDSAVSAIAMPPFEIALDRAASFRGGKKSPLVLLGGDGVEALREFRETLGIAMQNAGLGRWIVQRFTPHMTLFYADPRIEEQRIEPVRWTADAFVLVDSLIGQTRHVPIRRWALHG